MAAPLTAISLALEIFLSSEKSGGFDFSKAAAYERMKKYLLDDGFFLLPSCGRYLQIFKALYKLTHCYLRYIQNTCLMDSISSMQVVIINKAVNTSPIFNLALDFI